MQIERDPYPQQCLLEWSPDDGGGNFILAYTTSNGRVFLYDQTGQLIYSLLDDRHLPAWNSLHDLSISYAKVFFTEVRLKSHSRGEWHSEMILVDYSGRVNSFLLGLTGYQVLQRPWHL